MQSCRTLTPSVYRAEQKFNMLCAFSMDDSRSAAEIAAQYGYSVSSLYQFHAVVLDALIERRPGPQRRSCSTQQPHPSNDNSSARQNARSSEMHEGVSIRMQRRILLEASVDGLPLRGLATLFDLLGVRRGTSRSTLAQTLVSLGLHARNLLCSARDRLADSMTVLAGDEIFFHGEAVKVLLDPQSGAVLDVMRWPWRGGDEWQLFLEPFNHLELFVSDDGADLRSADTGHVWLGADMFHEQRWWSDTVFKPLDRRERELATKLISLRKRRDSSVSYDYDRRMLIARLEKERSKVEEAFYLAVEIEQRVMALFDPLDPEGKRWDSDSIYRLIAWSMEQSHALEPWLGARLYKHLKRRGPQYAGHHRLWDRVEVELHPQATWDRDRVLDALIRRRKLREKENHRERSAWERWSATQQRLALDEELERQITNLSQANDGVKRLLKRPARSSSLVESFNSRLRVLQSGRRNVSDALLWLSALQWNLSRREKGPRNEQSAWQQLGLIAKDDMRSWSEILLDTMPD